MSSILYGDKNLTYVNTEYGYIDGRNIDHIVLVISADDRTIELSELLEKCENRIKARKTALHDAHIALQTAYDNNDAELMEIAMSNYRHCEKALHNAELDHITIQNQVVTLKNGQYIIYS